MALTPSTKTTPESKKLAEDDVLMREVDDAVRQDQYADFLARFGKPLLLVVVVAVAAFGGFLLWQNSNEATMEERSETLVTALDQIGAGNFDTASSTLEPLAENGDAETRAIVSLLRAGIALEQEKPEEAARIYATLADDGDAPAELRDLARIREMTVTYDDRKPADVVASLRSLAVPGNAYFGSAGELVAMAYLDQGNREQAGTLFGEIAKSEDVPESARFRARQMAGLLGVDAIEDVDEILDEMSADTQGGPTAE